MNIGQTVRRLLWFVRKSSKSQLDDIEIFIWYDYLMRFWVNNDFYVNWLWKVWVYFMFKQLCENLVESPKRNCYGAKHGCMQTWNIMGTYLKCNYGKRTIHNVSLMWFRPATLSWDLFWIGNDSWVGLVFDSRFDVHHWLTTWHLIDTTHKHQQKS